PEFGDRTADGFELSSQVLALLRNAIARGVKSFHQTMHALDDAVTDRGRGLAELAGHCPECAGRAMHRAHMTGQVGRHPEPATALWAPDGLSRHCRSPVFLVEKRNV